MRFDVSELLSSDSGATESFEADGHCEVDEGEERELSGTVEVMRTNLGVFVRARLKLDEQETCSRCLKPLTESVRIEFDEQYRAEVDPRSGAMIDPEEDADVFLLDDGVLDLTEAVRQYRETALAMQPLCRPDCKGLCPVCGSDLNEGPCSCDTGTDSRWSALAALRGAAPDGRD